MDSFNGAKLFAGFALGALAAAIIAFPVAGWFGIGGVLVGLYMLLGFFNALEGNPGTGKSSPPPRRDQQRERSRGRRNRKRKQQWKD